MIRRNVALVVAALALLVYPAPARAQGTFALASGAGDGSISVDVDAFGAFMNYSYDPPGPLGPQSTFSESNVAMRIGPAGPRNWLNGAASPVTGTSTSCTSTFTIGGLSFKLDQTIATVLPQGVMLTQTYTITNTSAATIDFDLVRYLHPHLGGGITMGGGRFAGPPEFFRLFDKNNSPNTVPLEITGQGGTVPATDRFEIDDFPRIDMKILAGTAFNNTVINDANADGVIDAGMETHATIGVRNTFSIAAGASDTYTTTTFFGSSVTPTPTPAPTPPPPAPTGIEGSYIGSSGLQSPAQEGTFGLGSRGASLPCPVCFKVRRPP